MNIQISEHFNYRKLIRFTIPTIAMMLFTSIYGVVDGIFISNCVGSEAFAAINLIWPVLMILGSVGFMIGTGGSALVSKTLGEGKEQKANEIFSVLIAAVVVFGTILAVIGMLAMRPISSWLGAEGEMLEYCVVYGMILLIGNVPFMLQNAFQSFLVVAERPQMGLKISVAAGVTNMVLDFVFVYLFNWGVAGAAAATVASQLVGSVIPLVFFARKNPSPLRLIKFEVDGNALLKTCTNGSSEMLTNLSMSLVSMLYNFQLMKFAGADGVAAYGIIMYVSFIFSGTYLGYSIGAAPIVSFHYGAGNHDELKSLFKKSLMLMSVTSVILTGAAELTSGILAGVFVSYDAELLAMTTLAIQLYSISYLFNGINVFSSAFFTALNDGLVSAVISFLRTLVFQVVMIFLLPALLGLEGIWLSIVAAEILALVVSVFCFVKFRKKYHYV
ncbi:MAG: MATE family efflux transporter [Roseburia sp.]|nr:MATE family efflux transporter [Roseburia sp.]